MVAAAKAVAGNGNNPSALIAKNHGTIETQLIFNNLISTVGGIVSHHQAYQASVITGESTDELHSRK